MPVNYAEVLKDLEAREGALLTELNTVRSAKPAIKLLMDAQLTQEALNAPRKKYIGMGTKAALRDIYSETSDLLTREQLHEQLRTNGWTTESKDPLSVISATLSQLTGSGELQKVEDRWRRPVSIRINLPDSVAAGFEQEIAKRMSEQRDTNANRLAASSAPQPPSSQSPSDAQE